jgi:hypothetical protein
MSQYPLVLEGTDEMKSLIQGRAKMEASVEGAGHQRWYEHPHADGIRKNLLDKKDLLQVRKVC